MSPLRVQVFMLSLVLLAAARAHADFDGTNPLTWPLLLGFAAVVVGAALISRSMDRRDATPGARSLPMAGERRG